MTVRSRPHAGVGVVTHDAERSFRRQLRLVMLGGATSGDDVRLRVLRVAMNGETGAVARLQLPLVEGSERCRDPAAAAAAFVDGSEATASAAVGRVVKPVREGLRIDYFRSMLSAATAAVVAAALTAARHILQRVLAPQEWSPAAITSP